MAKDTKVNIITTASTAMAYFSGEMVDATEEDGLTVNNTGRVR